MTIQNTYTPTGTISSTQGVSVTANYTDQAVGDVIDIYWGAFAPITSAPLTALGNEPIPIPAALILDGMIGVWSSVTDDELQTNHSIVSKRLINTNGLSAIKPPVVISGTNGSKSGFTALIPGNPAPNLFLKQGDVIDVIWDIFDAGTNTPNPDKRTTSPSITLDTNYPDGYKTDLHLLTLSAGDRLGVCYTFTRSIDSIPDPFGGDPTPKRYMQLTSTYGDLVATQLPAPVFTQAVDNTLNLANITGDISIEIPAPASASSTQSLTIIGVGLDAQNNTIPDTAFHEGPEVIKVNPYKTTLPRALFLKIPDGATYSLYYTYGDATSPATTVKVLTGEVQLPCSMWGWGDASSGAIGPNTTNGDGTSFDPPIQQVNDKRWLTASTTAVHVLTISEDETLFAWGNNSNGQTGIGNPGITTVLIPQRIGERADWKLVAAGTAHSYAVDGEGALWAAGENTFGALGNGVSNTSHTAALTRIDSANLNGKWSLVSAGTSNGLGIKENGSLWTWGRNDLGQLGLGDKTLRATPQEIPSGLKWVKACMAKNNGAAINESGDLYIWGDNSSTILSTTGLPDTTITSTLPRRVDFQDRKWSDVALGDTFILAIEAETGDLYTWGTGNSGELGLGPTITTVSVQPEKINFSVAGRCAKVAANTKSAGAIIQTDNGGRIVFRWGEDDLGQVLGDGTSRPALWTPVSINSKNKDWEDIYIGTKYTIGLRTGK